MAEHKTWKDHLSKAWMAFAMVAFFGLVACNTIEGAGQDVKATGQVIEKTADDAKPK